MITILILSFTFFFPLIGSRCVRVSWNTPFVSFSLVKPWEGEGERGREERMGGREGERGREGEGEREGGREGWEGERAREREGGRERGRGKDGRERGRERGREGGEERREGKLICLLRKA